MSGLRTIGVPLDHLLAELVAFPLAAEWSLLNPTTSIDPRLEGRSRRLWQAAEKHLLTSIPGFSVDELDALRDATWFARAPGAVPMHEYLRALSTQFLRAEGNVARPNLPKIQRQLGERDSAPQVAARQAVRWITFALPPDLLVAGLGTPVHALEILSPALARALRDATYVESHLHLGAGLEFGSIWPGTMSLLGSRALSANFFESTGADFDDGRQLAHWLIRAGLARYILGTFLTRASSQRSFLQYFEDIRGSVTAKCGVASFALLRRALVDLRNGRLSPDIPFIELRELYAELTGVRTAIPARSVEEWMRADPLWRCFPTDRGSPELGLVRCALQYLYATGGKDEAFPALFWQVVRVRCAMYRFIVQRPLTPGLEWFVRFYGRMARSKNRMPDRVKLLLAARLSGAGLGLRALEVRTSPGLHGSEILEQVKELSAAAQSLQEQHSGLEIALVYHLTKERSSSAAHWSGSHADPTPIGAADWAREGRQRNLSGVRYGTYFASRRQQAQSLVWVLHHFPDSIRLIRGVDVCTDELGVPNWVLAPLVQYIRDAAMKASRRVFPGGRSERFGTTVHAGEDFVHLLTGLRNLSEAVTLYQLDEGDRIGHALALGVDPVEWAQRAGRLAVLVEDRLFDLAWVWHCLSEDLGNDRREGRLDREIGELSQRMFGKAISPYEVLQLMNHLGNPRALRLAGFPEYRTTVAATFRRLKQYLCEPAVFRRGRETVWINPLQDRELMVHVQGQLREKIAGRGIAIEVNPTSNLLVGDFGNLASHPLWRLRPPIAKPELPDLLVCIGSDDPAIFASSTRDEYQWLDDAMRIAGVSAEDARRWINRTRQCGLDTRFSVQGRIGSIATLATPTGDMPVAPL